jgi:hypothetical protein
MALCGRVDDDPVVANGLGLIRLVLLSGCLGGDGANQGERDDQSLHLLLSIEGRGRPRRACRQQMSRAPESSNANSVEVCWWVLPQKYLSCRIEILLFIVRLLKCWRIKRRIYCERPVLIGNLSIEA